MKLDAAPWTREKLLAQGGQARALDRVRAVDRLHLRRLLHADPRRWRPKRARWPSARGKRSGSVLRLRHLRQRRLHARAGVQVHVPVRALPERDVRPDTLIITYDAARGEPRGARARKADRAGRRPGRLHRLQPVRAGLPDRHRHPQRPAVRVHRLRRLHRRLRQRHGQDGLPARADPLLDRERRCSAAGRGAQMLAPRAAAAGAGLRAASWSLIVAALGASLALRAPFKVDVVRDRGTLAREVDDGQHRERLPAADMNADERAQRFTLLGRRLGAPRACRAAHRPARAFPRDRPGLPRASIAVRVQAAPHDAEGSQPIEFELKTVDGEGSAVTLHEKSRFMVPAGSAARHGTGGSR